MNPTLTVFTPTYNRAYCLPKAYQALCRQTCKDFIWLIVDDGSTDETPTLIESWKQEKPEFPIVYCRKQNGGLASGYNAAISVIETELCVCVDSDDYLTEDAVEAILRCWKERGGDQYAGIVGLDCFENGEIIGDPLPDQESVNLIDLLFGKYPIRNGDRKNIVRTELYKRFAPMPEFSGEKDFNPHYLHIKISQEYDFLILNKRLCVVEYQPDGMTNTIFRQYLRSPQSFREMRLLDLSLKGAPAGFSVKKTIHYIASCVLSRSPCLCASPKKLLTILLYPLGIAMVLYLKAWGKRRNGVSQS